MIYEMNTLSAIMSVVCQSTSWMIWNWRHRRWSEWKRQIKCLYILFIYLFLIHLKNCWLNCWQYCDVHLAYI